MNAYGWNSYRRTCHALILTMGFIGLSTQALAIDVKLTAKRAGQIMTSARMTMEKATSNDEMFDIIKEADKKARIGDDPETNPCGSSAIMRTKTYWLEYFGREEARRSKVADSEVRMPESKIKAIMAMPHLELEIGLCGKEEFFAEGVDVVLQQGSRNVRAIETGKVSRGRKIPGSDTDYVSRLSARFVYGDFDPQAHTTLVIFFPDGKLINIDADFSAIK